MRDGTLAWERCGNCKREVHTRCCSEEVSGRCLECAGATEGELWDWQNGLRWRAQEERAAREEATECEEAVAEECEEEEAAAAAGGAAGPSDADCEEEMQLERELEAEMATRQSDDGGGGGGSDDGGGDDGEGDRAPTCEAGHAMAWCRLQ